MAEPFRDPLDYLLQGIRFAPIWALLFGVGPWIVGTLPVLWISRRFFAPSARRDALLRILLLSPGTMTFPVILCAILSGLTYAQSSNFQFGTGKPGWLMSPMIPALCAVAWTLLPVLLVLTLLVASRRLSTMPLVPAYPVCATCGYNLTGNVSGRCPECGEPTP